MDLKCNKQQILRAKLFVLQKTTAPHAVSYPFSIYYNLGHGHSVSLTLNEFLKFNYRNIEKQKTQKILKKSLIKFLNQLIQKIFMN